MAINTGVTLSDETLAAFRRRFDGEIIGPADPGYEAARRTWNGAIDKRPVLIVRPLGTADVAEAVRLARDERLEIAVRGGGHSASGQSMSEGGLTIDLGRMRAVSVDPGTRRAWVQGGALLGDFDREATAHGLAAPAGVISHTGVGGLTLGGGYGYLARLHGLACDNVEAWEVVTADGRVVRVTDASEPDLAWALRGGGGNFGVVTTFEFRLHPIPPEILSIDLGFPLDAGPRVLRALLDLASEAPDAFQASAAVVTARDAEFVPPGLRGRPLVWASYTYAGDPDEGRRFAPLLRAAASPAIAFDETIPYRDLQRTGDENQRPGRRQYVKSHFVRDTPDAFIDAFLARGGDDGPLVSGSLGQLGGAIARVDPATSAFSGRDAAFDCVIGASWDDGDEDEARLAAARRFGATVSVFGTGRSYVNALEGAGPAETAAAYGQETHDRLARVKARFDPDNAFRLNQNVRPAGAT